MKALRALLGAVAAMTAVILVFLFRLSLQKQVVLDGRSSLEGEDESPHVRITSSLAVKSHSTISQQDTVSTSHNTSQTTPQSPSSSSSSTTTTVVSTVTNPSAAAPLLFDDKMIGQLNYDLWRNPVGYLVDDLRIKRVFPTHPEVRRTITKLQTTFSAVDKDSLRNKYGHKIYGYLLPSTAGSYQFQAALTQVTAACSMEVWLSSDSSPLASRLVAAVDTPLKGRKKTEIEKTQDSPVIQLGPTPYYFEFLEKAFDGKCVATLQWKEPGSNQFTTIPADHFAMAVKLTDKSEYEERWPIANELLKDLPSNKLQSHGRVKYIGDTTYRITDLDVLESCQFTSKIAYRHKLNRQYQGVYQIKESLVFPDDHTVFYNWYKKDRGNKLMTSERSQAVLEMYKKAFAKKGFKGEVKVRMMEESVNKDAGSRFLLELDIQLKGVDTVNHTSEYVYLPTGSHSLCHTSNFQWKRNVDVHIVVSVKNLGLWVQHLIHNMEHVYKVTKDEHFQLIIVDYGSEDLDIEAELRASSLPRWKVISLSGGFSRSGGLQAGIDYVTDPDSIVMTVDMHLTLPPGFVEYTRRHVVKGKMGFAPMFFRLNKGYTEININGFWETLTYGLLGMYKSDWVTTGGFDTQKYTTKWGGEDWDAVDKVVEAGLELFRVRYPGLVHYFHTRTGMWKGKTK